MRISIQSVKIRSLDGFDYSKYRVYDTKIKHLYGFILVETYQIHPNVLFQAFEGGFYSVKVRKLAGII
jgi:hypothetical protein